MIRRGYSSGWKRFYYEQTGLETLQVLGSASVALLIFIVLIDQSTLFGTDTAGHIDDAIGCLTDAGCSAGQQADQPTTEEGQSSGGPVSNTASDPWVRPADDQVYDLFEPDAMFEVNDNLDIFNDPAKAAEAMKTLYDRDQPIADVNDPTVQAALQQLVQAYNDPAKDMDYMEEQYRRYLELEAEMAAVAAADPDVHMPDELVPLVEVNFTVPVPFIGPQNVNFEIGDRDHFWASGGQVRFGTVVGEALDIDPAFAAGLSPTGGTPGAGEKLIIVPDHDSAISMHSGFHDAAGFLDRFWDVGPGYDYLQVETTEEEGSNTQYAGQNSGIEFWTEHADQGGYFNPIGDGLHIYNEGISDWLDHEWNGDKYDEGWSQPLDDFMEGASDKWENFTDGVDDLVPDWNPFGQE